MGLYLQYRHHFITQNSISCASKVGRIGEYDSQDDEDSVEEDEEKDDDEDDEEVTFNLDVDTDGGMTDQDRYEAYLAEQSLTKKDVSTYASWLLKAKEIGT